MKGKKFRIESFSPDRTTYKGLISDVSDLGFTKEVNGGVGELKLKLPRKIDDFGYNQSVGWMYGLDIYVVDNDDPNGKRIYSGYIDNIDGIQGGSGQEYVEVTALGYHTMMGRAPYKDGNNFSISHNSTTADVVFKDIIDKYRLYHPDTPINYTASSVDTGLQVFSDDFNNLTCLEALDRLMLKAGDGWYWYVDADNVAWLKQKPSVPTHIFIYGKHIVNNFAFNKSIRQAFNEVSFWNGRQANDEDPISYYFKKTDNQDAHWKRWTRVTDSRITNRTYAENLIEAYLDANHEENHGNSFIIVDNNYANGRGYDIESVDPGDTCMLLNVDDEQVFSDNMFITSVDFTMEVIRTNLEDLRTLTSRSLNDIRRKLNTQTYAQGQPEASTYTFDKTTKGYFQIGKMYPVDENWTEMDLKEGFTNPIPVGFMNTYAGSGIARVMTKITTNADGTPKVEFRVREQPDDDDSHADEQLAVMAVESGIGELPNGIPYEAGQVTETDNDTWNTINLSSTFTNTPVVLVCYEDAGELFLNVRLQSVTTTGFDIKLQLAQGQTSTLDSVIYWIALDIGADDNILGVDFQQGSVDGVGNYTTDWEIITWSIPFSKAPLVFPSMITTAGADPGFPRMKMPTKKSIQCAIEEDTGTSGDSEQNHATETVSFLAFTDSWT